MVLKKLKKIEKNEKIVLINCIEKIVLKRLY